MKPIRSGFDGLEFAICVSTPSALCDLLDVYKDHAKKIGVPAPCEIGGEWLEVRETGAKGGYTYSCRHEETGDWFFKKPSKNDPWGIRFSASSSALVILGLEGLRQRIETLLSNLDIVAPTGAFHPSRIDFAVDFLAPDFQVSADNFIIHSRASRKIHDQILDIETNGRSNRTTSVTIGKMPNRQVIIYDKREEVVVKHKPEWATIWARAIHGPEACSLDLSNRETSQIWRVELRAAKRHLKDIWDINSWASLYELLPRVFDKMLSDIRYTEPTSDTNRARWPDHTIWNATRQSVLNDLFDHIPTMTPDEYIEIKKSRKIEELESQIFGLAISSAAIRGTPPTAFQFFLDMMPKRLGRRISNNGGELDNRFVRAQSKYSYLVNE